MRVRFNITVWDAPCYDMSLDYQDVMGSRVVDVKSTVFKRRLKKNKKGDTGEEYFVPL